MRKHLVSWVLCMMCTFPLVSLAQTNYTSSPAVGTYGSCPSDDITGVGCRDT